MLLRSPIRAHAFASCVASWMATALPGGLSRLLRTEAIGHDPKSVVRGLIQAGTLQASHQLKGVHTGDGEEGCRS